MIGGMVPVPQERLTELIAVSKLIVLRRQRSRKPGTWPGACPGCGTPHLARSTPYLTRQGDAPQPGTAQAAL